MVTPSHHVFELSLALLLFAAAPASAQPTSGAPITGVAVTLVSGDRVTIADRELDVAIQRGPGRESVGFIIERQTVLPGQKPHLFVIPEDAIPLLAAARVDRRLFDVTLLVAYGYDDAHRGDLPLLMTHSSVAARIRMAPSSAPAGAAIERSLPAINGASLRAPKARTHELWRSLATNRKGSGGAATALDGGAPDRLWLDGRLEPVLDRSASQIGAPAAWALGYEGNGVVVAVLDTGVDITHPDLADAIVVSRNFMDGPLEDEMSHGTHVASIIAGSGSASGGRYRGVAPGAQLLSAKVCRNLDCPESSIIAALHWAVAEEGARVVNLSLGDTDAIGFDPIEEAVSTLAAQYGALFVAAAGNSGPHPRTIARPGNLAVALTVGAVDADDRVTAFSARGATAGDHAIKPDLTAPSGVTSAQALGAPGTPGGVLYTPFGGTSSATPHVAGAAALLFEQHPDWSAADVKAALMGSAAFNPAFGVFDQGAGRVDVEAALGTSFLPSTSSVSFGLQRWPHEDDEVVTRTVSLRNLGAATELLFELDVIGPDGAAAPAGMFTVSPSSALLLEQGTVSVRLTADARLGALDGVYGGRVLVSDGVARSLSIPLALERELESYDLVMRHLDRAGVPTPNWRSVLIASDGATRVIDHRGSPEVGDVTLRLPKRDGYALDTFIYETDAEAPLTRLLTPNFSLDRDTLLELDARVATPVRVIAPTATAEHLALTAILVLPRESEDYSSRLNFGRVGVVAFHQAELGAPAPPLEALLTSQWLGGGMAPALFAGAWRGRGRLPAGPVSFAPDQAAVVHADYAMPSTSMTLASELDLGAFLDLRFQHAVPRTPVALPHRRTEYLFSDDPNVRWISGLRMRTDDFSQFAAFDALSSYEAGQSYNVRWGRPVFSPALPEADDLSQWAYRRGNRLVIRPPLYSDGAGHSGTSSSEGNTALYRDGELIAVAQGDVGLFDVPPEPATYRIEIESRQSAFELSPEQTVAWTFASSHVSDDTSVRLPLLVVLFTPELLESGLAPSGSPFTLPIAVDQYGRESPPEVPAPSVEVSYDDGAIWNGAPLERDGTRWNARLEHPSGSRYVSLRASAQDEHGNRVEQTVLRAYELAAPETQTRTAPQP